MRECGKTIIAAGMHKRAHTIFCRNTVPIIKCIFVGDASMSPYEIAYPGGANEHWNAEAGQVWLKRARDQWQSNLWINPMPEKYWNYTHSIKMIQEIFGPRIDGTNDTSWT